MSGPTWPHGIVFDLDGTLVDSVGDIAAALNGALADIGLGPLTDNEVRGMVGRGADVTVRRALTRLGAEDRDPDALHAGFVKHYAAKPAERSTLYPGATSMLARFAAEGRRLAICTNKPEQLTETIVRDLGVWEAFGAVVGASDRLPRKPDPAMLAAAFAGIGVDPADGVMVGDSVTDVGTARALGIPIVLVSFGYTPVPARDLGADAVIDHLDDLAGVLSQLVRPS
jgi:phosphoglycolate phosphatase